MADIVINEISQNYSYVIGDSSYCCVALPITASWGPAYTGFDSSEEAEGLTKDDVLEDVVWTRFRANSQGLESFVSTYRGPAQNYRLSQDFSYQMAVSLLTAGYDVLVCRVCPGAAATSMLRRSYVGEIVDNWFSTITNGNLVLPIWTDKESKTALDAMPFVVNSDHPLTVTSTNPNFPGATLSSVSSTLPEGSDDTGIYAVSLNGGVVAVFHVKGEDATNPVVWESYGIRAKDMITYTGDKVLSTLDGTGHLAITAKYPGTFGNRLQCSLRRMSTVGINYWNLIVYVVDASGVRVAVENLNFVFDIDDSTDSILFWDEVTSQFVNIVADNLDESSKFTESSSDVQDEKLNIVFSGGRDKSNFEDASSSLLNAIQYAAARYNTSTYDVSRDDDAVIFAESTTAIAKGSSVEFEGSDTCYDIQRISSIAYKSAASQSADWVTLEPSEYTIAYPESGLRDHATITFAQDAEHLPADSSTGSSIKVSYTYVACSVDGQGNKHKLIDSNIQYIKLMCEVYDNYLSDPSTIDDTTAATWEYLEWLFTYSLDIYDLLHDKLAYNPNRVISPGWDDQNFLRITGDSSYPHNITTPSPLHLKLMETAYYSRCATAYIDLPKSLSKKHVSDDSQNARLQGYAQLLARQSYADTDGLFTTHSALFGPWGTYMYVGTNRQSTASPSFLALLIQRSMILNQSLQYEWIQPSSRKNRVNIGRMDYTVSKKYLDIWQPDPDTEGGVGVNAIANIPDLGLSIWGDSTLYENPPATYQALRNLSTRLLVNAIKNVVYKVGISITFQYTNQLAFSSFYVGVTPILDTMKNSGAIGDYKVVIGNDFDAVGMVKANSCVGKIYITPNGTIQHIVVDLIALPPMTDLSNYS